jgi:hypothetical protein
VTLLEFRLERIQNLPIPFDYAGSIWLSKTDAAANSKEILSRVSIFFSKVFESAAK